jgi:hypothetical protein
MHLTPNLDAEKQLLKGTTRLRSLCSHYTSFHRKMYLHCISAAVLALASIAQTAALQPRDLLQNLQDQALESLKEAELNGTVAKRKCSLSNAGVRRDW